MKILILGGGGMIGQKLARHLLEHGLGGQGDLTIISHDIGFAPDAAPVGDQRIGNLADPGVAEALAGERPDLIFHLASVVSGEAETDFDKGWRVNMQANWALLEALRAQHQASGGAYRPRLVFTSSIAVFGAPYPGKIGDEFLLAPQTSYGAQKLITETMISDFSRKGFIDGISIRLPTICVRPGKANLAASSFFSGIIREPLNGQEAILPVADDVRHWLASPRSAVGFVIHAAGLDTALLQGRRALNLPGVSVTVAQQIEALRDIAGEAAVALIRRQPDPAIQKIVSGWPRDFAPERALALGFRADADFHAIVQSYIDEDLPRR